MAKWFSYFDDVAKRFKGTKLVVQAPATNTDLFVPQWDGANTRLLKDGLAISFGGNGTADAGKLVKYATAGGANVTESGEILAASFRAVGGANSGGAFLDGSGLTKFDGSGNLLWTLAQFAFVNFDGTTGTTTANVTGTYARTSPSTTLTVTVTGHGHIVGHRVYCSFTSGTGLNGLYAVASVVDANNFTITTVASTTTSGNVTLLRKPINASSGVQSVTYSNAAGQFVVNFSTAFSDAFYSSPTGSANVGGAGIAYMGSSTKVAQACSCVTAGAAALATPASASEVTCTFIR